MAVKFQTTAAEKPKEKYPPGQQPNPKEYNGDPWFFFRGIISG
ncbi:MAG: hypothetical protein WD824_20570 [Cyclobacteriaceae bacterium]